MSWENSTALPHQSLGMSQEVTQIVRWNLGGMSHITFFFAGTIC